MNFETLYDQIAHGEISKEDAKRFLSMSYIKTAHNYTLDINRSVRTGIPEIIYAEYKCFRQIVELTEKLMETAPPAIISRFPDNKKLKETFMAKYPVHIEQNLLVVGDLPKAETHVLVLSGGAADHPIAAEVDLCLKALGINSLLFEDRGIAHPTRVLDAIQTGIEANVKVAVVIAGMEGALATYVSSLLPVPVIGVPTSVGYGYRAKESALISMLSACTPNLTVVNIDGGVRAAVVASLIAKNSL